MATWRNTDIKADSAVNPTWRTTRTAAEYAPAGSIWRTTRIAADRSNGAGIWRVTRVAAEVLSSGVKPIADAGIPFAANAMDLIQLDGSASTALSGGTISTYTWRIISQDASTVPSVLTNRFTVNPTLRAPLSTTFGVVTVGLIVVDSNGLSSLEVQNAISFAPASLAVATSTGWGTPAGILVATPSGWL